MPPQIVRLPEISSGLPLRGRGFVDTRGSQVEEQLRLLRERQDFQGNQAGKDRSMQALLALMQQRNTGDQLSFLKQQFAAEKDENAEDRAFRQSQADLANARSDEALAHTKAQDAEITGLRRDQFRLEETMARANTEIVLRQQNASELHQYRRDETDRVNNAMTVAAMNKSAVGIGIREDAERLENAALDFAIERFHGPEIEMRKALGQYAQNPRRGSVHLDDISNLADSMVRTSVSAMTNKGNPLEERLGGMNFIIGNSSGPGSDGQSIGMYDSVQAMMQQAVEIARENGDTSTVKRFEKKMDDMDAWALSMRLHSGPVIDEYQKMVAQQGALDSADRTFNQFAADANANKGVRVNEFAGRNEDALFDAINQISPAGPSSSFPSTLQQPSFGGQGIDSSRITRLLDLLPAGQPQRTAGPGDSTSAGLRLIQDAIQGGEDSRAKAIDDRKAAEESARVGRLTNMINTMKVSGASEDDIARAVFEAQNPRLGGVTETMLSIGKQ